MKHVAILSFVLFFVTLNSAYAYTESDLKAANKYYEQKAYQLAATEYAKFLSQKASSDELAREVTFKWSDSIVKGKNESSREKAEKNLQDLVSGKDHDQWWAESGVTLASVYIERDPYGKQQDIKKWLEDARDWWAGSSDIKLARKEFINTSFMLADFVTTRWGWYSPGIRPIRLGIKKEAIVPPNQPDNIGLQILFEEILKVAKSEEDKAHAHFGLAMSWMQNYSGDQKLREKAINKFDLVIKKYTKTEWADDSYYQLGNYYEGQRDYINALKTYRDMLSNFRAGESQWVNDIERRIENITSPSLNVSVGNTFIPDSEIQFSVNWRNITQANFMLYELNLANELKLYKEGYGYSNYQDLLRQLVEETGRYRSLPVHKSWEVDLKNDGKHMPHGEHKGLAEWHKDKDKIKVDQSSGKLPTGAYILVVSSGEKVAYDLVLVSDIALVSKTSEDMSFIFAMDAKTGQPVAGATIKYVYSYYNENGSTRWEEGHGISDEDGILNTRLKNPRRNNNYHQNHNLFAVVTTEDNRQAFVQSNYYKNSYNNKGEWWLYAFADRPAYRPNETVSFKGILRHPEGGLFSNPEGKRVKGIIYDAQGKQVKEAIYTLNAYGAFSDTLILDEKAVLGEYRLQLNTADSNSHISSAQLFRLEEYKLPEFVVNVVPKPKEDETTNGVYRLGDTLEMEIDAQYYFGGAVAEAQVEYLIYQQAYYHQYRPTKKYGWYYEDMYPSNYAYGHGQLLKQDKVTTDKDGKVTIEIETPADSGTDLKYHIEARVVDKSRREIIGTSDIKVTKNAFFSYLEPAQNLYRPGDKVKVNIKTMTANEAPVAVEGKITVSRNWWRDPVIQGDRVITQAGYSGNELFSKFVKTNARGEAVFEFEPTENGYYVISFTGFDAGNEVTGTSNVFVSDSTATNIGYRYSGLQIITEKDTYAVGETARAMIVSDQPDTWVLFTKETDELYGYDMLHLEGSVKLVEFKVTENFTPNVFLNAISGSNFQLKTTSLQLIVPPDDKFLNVKIISDKEIYQPQEEGTFELSVADKDGKPIKAEIALGLTDASVYYIQGEFAPDIRQFFYGDKRQHTLQTQASFYQRRYVNLVRGESGQIMTKAEFERQLRAKSAGSPGKQEYYGERLDDVKALGAIGGKYDNFRDEDNSMSRGANAPSVASEMVMEEKEGRSSGFAKKNGAFKDQLSGRLRKGSDDEMPEEEQRVRNDFRSTITWLPSVITDEKGKATVNVKFPDSLTTWRMTARALTQDTSVGNVTHEVKSNKDLMIRLQAPRFFTERDLVAVSALIDNMSDNALTVSPIIQTEGLVVTGLYVNGKFVKGEMGPVEVPANGQTRVDWAVSAQKVGLAKITVRAKGEKLSDAMEKTYPVIPHGIEKFIAKSLVMKGAGDSVQTQEFAIHIPKERIKESTSLQITVSPSMAANLLDALPYLADYPYGCVEQTMSRFLPAAVVRKTMVDLGISKNDINSYISDVLEPRNDPKGHPKRRNETTHLKLDGMVDDGLKRLYDFQHSDGGWGWWKTGDSDRFMTTYVVWGMSLARDADVKVKQDVINRAVQYLQVQLVEEEDHPDMLAWMLHALAAAGSDSEFESKQRDRLWKMRDNLNPYSRALFALSEHARGSFERSAVLGQNVVNGIMEDIENGTAHWGESGIHYRWSEGGVEATAFIIKALSQINPESTYLDPAVKWMTLNRRGGRWKNTRDTAISILGLADYLKATKELAPNYSYEVLVNGVSVREGQVNSSNILSFNRLIDIPADQLHDGKNTIKVVMNGKGALYASAHAKYFTLEEGITKAGNEIFVTRKYFIKSVKETLMKGYTNEWKPLEEGAVVQSGDRIRAEVILEAKNHYEYLVAEDYKPAGLEAVELNSGAGFAIKLDSEDRETSEHTPLYQEFRDQKASFFIAKLKQGKHLLRYELRAEIPGTFHAMPNQAHAMYVPEIRANSDENTITVSD